MEREKSKIRMLEEIIESEKAQVRDLKQKLNKKKRPTSSPNTYDVIN